jgi:hypothetical protein
MNELLNPESELKLFMILIGSKAPNRHVEQHDYFFGIAKHIKDLVPDLKAFWPEAGNSIHLDGWREVKAVDGYQIKVVEREEAVPTAKKLFFINLGGYQRNKLEEQHYVVLTVQEDRALAVQNAKKTLFFKSNTIKGATSHIDDKYGVDVDDIYNIEDILTPGHKDRYHINISAASELEEDEIKLGYFKLNKL